MPYCKVRQAEIYYEEIGEGVPVLMIHGFTPDHRLMHGCMEPLFKNRKGYKRIYFDLPGMGQTKNYTDISSSDEILEAVLDFVNMVLPNRRYIVVGESYGGYLARGLIQRQSDKLLGAAFICPVIVPDVDKSKVPNHEVLEKDDDFLAMLTKEQVSNFSRDNIILNEYTWLRYNEEILSGCNIADYDFLNRVRGEYALSFVIDQTDFAKPSIFLLGRQDSIVGYEDALSIIKKFSRGTFAIVDKAGHNLQIEQSELFNTVMSEWLDRIENTSNYISKTNVI